MLPHAWINIIISDLLRVQEEVEVPSVEEADQPMDERIVVLQDQPIHEDDILDISVGDETLWSSTKIKNFSVNIQTF